MKSFLPRLIILAVGMFALFCPIFFKENITIVLVHNKTAHAMGAGFFIDEKSILTVSHVIEPRDYKGAQGEIEVLDKAQHWHKVKVIGIDTDTDIAVLSPINWCEVKPIKPCSRYIEVEDFTSRIVFYSRNYGYSSFDRFFINFMFPTYLEGEILGFDAGVGTPFISHDSAIIPGYSGTPLLDKNNCYVGMNVSVDVFRPKVSRAVPGQTIDDIVPQLLKNGKINVPFLGIVTEQMSDGVFISGVIEGSPADSLNTYGVNIIKNIAKDDFYPTHRITAINGVEVNTLGKFWYILKNSSVGSIVTLTIKNSSGKIDLISLNTSDRFLMIRRYALNLRFLTSSSRILIA